MVWYWWACGAGLGWWPEWVGGRSGLVAGVGWWAEWMTAMADQASTVLVPRRRSAAA